MKELTILYARVSTAEQHIAIQQSQAEAAGYTFDEVVVDDATSGVSTKLSERQGGKRLFDLLIGGGTLVVRWVDRLGRDYTDVTESIRKFMDKRVVIRTLINNMTFDGKTTDPIQRAVRDALIAFMAATAEAQAEATKQAQKAGIAYAKQAGSYLGRKPSYRREQIEIALSLKQQGQNISQIARSLSLTRQTVYRILHDPAEAMRIVEQWQPVIKPSALAQ